MSEFDDFLEIQTKTAWGRTLADFAEWCGPAAGILAIDLGCGPGLLSAILADRYHVRSIGLDTNFDLLRSAAAGLPVTRASACALPFAPATFDLVTATNVIFLLGDPLRALSECHRVSKAGAALALLNPSEHLTVEAARSLADVRGLQGKNRESLLGWARRAAKHGGWSGEQARSLLEKAGFTVIEDTLRIGPGFARLTRARKAGWNAN
jgi:ubiquinone/menaquinone biosynthesis C-methylase UbiE